MSQEFRAGDYLIFQIESGYGLLRLLAIDGAGADRIWHVAGFAELFPDIDTAEAALATPESLTVSMPHAALTTRAFEATQTARMTNRELRPDETAKMTEWLESGGDVSDRSIRLMLGLR